MQVDSMEPIIRAEGHNRYTLNGDLVKQWHPGLVIRDSVTGDHYITSEAGTGSATIRTIGEEGTIWGVRPSDNFQRAGLSLLMDPQFDLVSLAGAAGTGKTFLAMAAALQLTFETKTYERIVITRETAEMGQKIGFLKGSEEEKVGPWFMGFWDNVKALTGLADDEVGKAGMSQMMDRIEMRSIGLMRGRSIRNSIIVIDETQNLTQDQIKNLVSRAGEGTKIVVLGNIAQVDTPMLTPQSCGLPLCQSSWNLMRC